MSSDAHEAAVANSWRLDRQRTLDISFRMLGDLGEAEDVVQETFSRLANTSAADIEDRAGWLIVVAVRLCIDRLRSRRRHPVQIRDDLDGQPYAHSSDPADRVRLRRWSDVLRRRADSSRVVRGELFEPTVVQASSLSNPTTNDG